MGNRSVDYREDLMKRLKNFALREAYINAALEEGDSKFLLTALKNCAEALGGLTWLNRKTHITQAALCKLLSKSGNLRYGNLKRVLYAFDLRLAVRRVSGDKV